MTHRLSSFEQEVCLFLPNASTIDASAAVSLYVSSSGGAWDYRGCAHNMRPNDVFALQVRSELSLPNQALLLQPGPHFCPSPFPIFKWPTAEDGTVGHVQIGVSIEPAAAVLERETVRVGSRLDFAKRGRVRLFLFLFFFFPVLDRGNGALSPPSPR